MSSNDNLNEKNEIQPRVPQKTNKLNPNSAFELVKSKIFEMYKIHSKNKHKKDK